MRKTLSIRSLIAQTGRCICATLVLKPPMAEIIAASSTGVLIAIFFIAVLAGVVKGIVGFAMPMVLISGLSNFVSPELALAALIAPTLVTNIWQAFRQGSRAAFLSLKSHRKFLLVGLVALVISSQAYVLVDARILLAVVGAVVAGFAAMQLTGWQPKLNGSKGAFVYVSGTIAGTLGGFSGIWGPPTVLYLTAMNTSKTDQVRIQGVLYGLGAVALTFAHIGSGVLNLRTAPLSIALIVPAVVGLAIGFAIQDRIDQRLFKRVTLLVLLIAGLNLLRRGLGG
jgi:uncharacterized protein